MGAVTDASDPPSNKPGAAYVFWLGPTAALPAGSSGGGATLAIIGSAAGILVIVVASWLGLRRISARRRVSQ